MDRILGDELPECIKIILSTAGYDRKISIKYLTEEKLNSLEDFISRNRMNIVSALTCCSSDLYKSEETFKFLPGHRTAIMGLVSALNDVVTSEYCDLMDDSVPKVDDDNSSIDSLIAKLESYFVEKKWRADQLARRSFSLGVKNNKVCAKYRCKCETELTIPYTTFWKTSNLKSHFIKFHSDEFIDVESERNEFSQPASEITQGTDTAATTLLLRVDPKSNNTNSTQTVHTDAPFRTENTIDDSTSGTKNVEDQKTETDLKNSQTNTNIEAKTPLPRGDPKSDKANSTQTVPTDAPFQAEKTIDDNTGANKNVNDQKTVPGLKNYPKNMIKKTVKSTGGRNISLNIKIAPKLC